MPSPQPVKLPFGKHLPDVPALANPGTPYLKNVIPANGYLRPFADLNPYSNSLDALYQGGFSGRDSAGDVYTFAGDVSKLYKMTADTFADVSQAMTTYATPSEGRWEFIWWSDSILIAVNGADAPQKIDPKTGTEFEDLGGSPEAAAHGAVVRSFVVLGNWQNNENVVAWSALDNAEEWNTDGTNQSDQQALASGGAVMRILGGEFGLIFCQSSVYRMTYVGSPVIFQFDEIAPGVGLLAPGGVAQFGNLVFFIGQNSFYGMDARGEPKPIGESRWNKTFFTELDGNHIDKIWSAIDPINTIWLVGYPTTQSASGLPNRLFLYNWATDDCSFVDIDVNGLLSAYTPGIALDDLTTQTGYSLDDLPFSLDSRVWQGGSLVLAGITRSNMLGFFSGQTLEAEIETVESDGNGQRLYVNGVRPLVDASDAEIAVATREFQHSNPILGAYSAIGADGLCPQHIEGRFLRARLKIPAGSDWSKAQGVEAYVSAAGGI